MPRYIEQVQDQDETQDAQLLHEMYDADRPARIDSMERTGYSDAAEKELALLSGYDPFSGEDLEAFFRRTADEALDLDVPTLEEVEAA